MAGPLGSILTLVVGGVIRFPVQESTSPVPASVSVSVVQRAYVAHDLESARTTHDTLTAAFSHLRENKFASFFYTPVSRMVAWENALLHGIAAATGISNFRLAF